jgi:hypothetical protein
VLHNHQLLLVTEDVIHGAVAQRGVVVHNVEVVLVIQWCGKRCCSRRLLEAGVAAGIAGGVATVGGVPTGTP